MDQKALWITNPMKTSQYAAVITNIWKITQHKQTFLQQSKPEVWKNFPIGPILEIRNIQTKRWKILESEQWPMFRWDPGHQIIPDRVGAKLAIENSARFWLRFKSQTYSRIVIPNLCINWIVCQQTRELKWIRQVLIQDDDSTKYEIANS